MIQVPKEQMQKLAPLFYGWEETLIWSCLQGYMGTAWVDILEKPKAAQIIIADFIFFAGKPDIELVKNHQSRLSIMVPQNQAWAKLIEQAYGNSCEKITRYAIKKESEAFNKERLKGFIEKLSPEFSIKPIDKKIYNIVKNEKWSSDLVSQFSTYKDFEKFGVGFVVLHKGCPVSGAASYTVYATGIEIEIDTKEEYRRKGLAAGCASALILECLDRGLYPSWDAANPASVALAEQLGYHFDKEYMAYYVRN